VTTEAVMTMTRHHRAAGEAHEVERVVDPRSRSRRASRAASPRRTPPAPAWCRSSGSRRRASGAPVCAATLVTSSGTKTRNRRRRRGRRLRADREQRVGGPWRVRSGGRLPARCGLPARIHCTVRRSGRPGFPRMTRPVAFQRHRQAAS
jgi:hypothetical protein